MKTSIRDIIDTLNSVNILKNIDIAIIEDIADHIETDSFAEGEFLVKHGELSERLFFIFDGKIEVKNPLNSDFLLQNSVTLARGGVIGEISLVVNTAYTADIIALRKTTVLYLNRDRFNYLVKKYRVFAEVLSNLITRRMGHSGGINKVGRYELLGKLGQGGMSTVFNAFDCELEREVAIKMLKYHLAFDSDYIERFEREARVIASLNHPNIVNVYEIVAEYSTRFIVMEKLHGDNLSVIQKKVGAFNLYETRMILSQLADALQYAHHHGERGIVHRDIKPSNIVMDKSGKIKLTDFGVAGPPRDQEINIEGTPSYLAPEII
ncbi:MAG: protein kinase, partial [Gammaproteobacteria bacterium]|nr:protein kinase [Gammaproteobacteria bacterium]